MLFTLVSTYCLYLLLAYPISFIWSGSMLVVSIMSTAKRSQFEQLYSTKPPQFVFFSFYTVRENLLLRHVLRTPYHLNHFLDKTSGVQARLGSGLRFSPVCFNTVRPPDKASSVINSSSATPGLWLSWNIRRSPWKGRLSDLFVVWHSTRSPFNFHVLAG